MIESKSISCGILNVVIYPHDANPDTFNAYSVIYYIYQRSKKKKKERRYKIQH